MDRAARLNPTVNVTKYPPKIMTGGRGGEEPGSAIFVFSLAASKNML
jgi:hypothetical protein